VDLQRNGYAIRKLVFETEPGILVPALLFEPNQKPAKPLPLVLYVHGEGKAADAGPDGPLEQLVRAGQSVLALDLRGVGETAPATAAANRPNYFGVDNKEAFLSLHLNRPLLGQRVQDVLLVLLRLMQEAEEGTTPEFHLVGVGSAAPIALHAAALFQPITKVLLVRPVVSWSAVVQTPISRNQLTNVVPGALQTYDLPELAATLAPRPLTIRGAVDPVHQPLSQAVLEQAYAACRSAYAQQQAAEHLRLEAGAAN
jgi:pimeloyl-ACP methyl ester carboxylesterase